jgi:type IV pilus assembly protein PilA
MTRFVLVFPIDFGRIVLLSYLNYSFCQGAFMKTTNETMNVRQAGFSLVELMVVVAIIGILATVAVPQVNKFMAKARQSEVKSMLSGLYTAEKSFYTEYNTFHTDFRTIGFSPEGRVRYNVGFSAAHAGCAMPPGLPAAASSFKIDGYCGVSPAFANGCSLLPEGQEANGAVGALAGTACNGTRFTAQGKSELVSNAGVADTWTIDEDKSLNQTVNGIP